MVGKEENKIFVGGLSWNVTERQLKHAFGRYGKILECQIMLERDTGRPRGFGFITYVARRGMEDAIREMHGREFGDREISVNKVQPRMGGEDLDHGYRGGGYSSGGRGSYGGGDRSAGQDDCFNCGCPGHWARDCPLAGGDRGGGGGSFSSHSRFEGAGGREPKMGGEDLEHCYRGGGYSYGGRGSYGGGDMSAGQDDCFKCGRLGHWARDCPLAGGDRGGGGGSFSSRSRFGGAGGREPKMGGEDLEHGFRGGGYSYGGRGNYGGGDMYAGQDDCFKCGHQGHWARDCPLAGGDRSGGGGSFSSRSRFGGAGGREPKMGGEDLEHGFRGGGYSYGGRGNYGGGDMYAGQDDCFKCGRLGHWARDCPLAGGDRGGGGGSFSSRSRFEGAGGREPKMGGEDLEHCYRGGGYSYGGRGSYGGGDMSAGQDDCFKCGRLGHWARDCPLAGGDRGGGGGSFSSRSRFGGAGGREPKMGGEDLDHCYRGGVYSYGGRGSYGGGDMSAGQDDCFKCGRLGHWARDCPLAGGDRGGGGGSFSSRSRFGGAGGREPKMGGEDLEHGFRGGGYSYGGRGNYGGGDMYAGQDDCFKCGHQGHWARDCPLAGGDRSGGGGSFSSRSRFGGVGGLGDRYMDDRYGGGRYEDRDRFVSRDSKYGSRHHRHVGERNPRLILLIKL